jgi:hypothetical protein
VLTARFDASVRNLGRAAALAPRLAAAGCACLLTLAGDTAEWRVDGGAGALRFAADLIRREFGRASLRSSP